MKYSLHRYLCVSNGEPSKQTLKDQGRMVHSSSICSHLGVLASFKCRLCLCFCLLSCSLPPLQWQLETAGAHMQHREKTKTKMSGLFLLSEHDRWKIEGGRKHSRQWRQLWNLGEPTATNLGFAGAQRCTVGSQGGALLCFRRRRGGMRENGSKWSWRAV